MRASILKLRYEAGPAMEAGGRPSSGTSVGSTRSRESEFTFTVLSCAPSGSAGLGGLAGLGDGAVSVRVLFR